jgi:diacylglycerol kinase family enzyme
LQEVINSLKGREVTLGYIPLMDTRLSRIFGLPDIETACRTIAARRIESLDLGLVNGNWFFTKVTFGNLEALKGGFLGLGMLGKSMGSTFEIKFSADGKYHGTLQATAGAIVNARDNDCGHKQVADPTDSVLDVLLLPKLSSYQLWQNRKHINSGCLEVIPGASTIHLKKMEITNPEGLPLVAEGRVLAKTPAIIEVLPKALKMIVGRDRSF